MQNTATRRRGTSFIDFEGRFPDPESCLAYLLETRLAGSTLCPKCGNATDFLKIKSARRYIARCCFDATLFPLRGTIFSGTRLPLNLWFRAILYFCNSSIGIAPNFLRQQLGISGKASVRMCKLIREHLTSIDSDIRLGPDGASVFVSETTMKGVSRRGRKNGVRFRILLATDGSESVAMPIPTGRFAASRDLLLNRLDLKATVVVQTDELKRKLLNHKTFARVKGRRLVTADDPDHLEFHNLSVGGIALKRFILQSHGWVSERHLESYLGHFSFLYRRRHRGSDAFWDAISGFPKFVAGA